METSILRKVAEEVASLKEQIIKLEIALNEVDEDIHREIKPEYLKKLKKIKKQKGFRFKDIKEFDKYFSA